MNNVRLDRILRVRRWKLWTLPVPARAYLLAVEAVGLFLGVWSLAFHTQRPGLVVVPLAVCAVASVEGARRVERVRRRTGSLHKDLQGAWTLAAALLLPAGVAVLFATAMYAWWRFRAGRCSGFAWVFTASMQVVGVVCAGTVYRAVGSASTASGQLPHTIGGVLAVLAAALTYELVDVLLCGVAIKLLAPNSTRAESFGDRGTAATDAAALTFGGLVALLAVPDAWAMLLALPAVVLLQRVLLVDQLAHEARTDTKTGLATAGWWRERTADELERARLHSRRLSVLVADLDHFKQINDLYGHLVGDEALSAVAGAVRAGVRGQDIAGRFGGEEFVVALPDTDSERARLVAERLRGRVAALKVSSRYDDSASAPVRGLTVSIGVASFPDDAEGLDALLRAADQALYSAKDAGRNRVRVADRVSRRPHPEPRDRARGAQRGLPGHRSTDPATPPLGQANGPAAR